MKNFKNIIIAFTLLFVFGCEEEVLPPEFQDATWSINLRPGAAQVVKQGSPFSFRDLSQGALSHEFTIEEGNKYLFPGYGANDSLPLYVNEKLGLTITNKDAHVLFLNQGINKVKLRNTFKDSVSYNATIPVPAFKENGVWVIENTWEIDVYTPLKPAFQILDKNGVEIISVTADQEVLIEDAASWPIVKVEAGDALTYIDLTTEDRPTGRSWRLLKGKPANSIEETIDVGYFSLGTFSAGSLISIREGDEVPEERVSKLIPLTIEVIPSSQPFVYNEAGGIVQNNDDSITFGVTGEIEPFLDENDNFIVHVVNTKSGFDQNISVLSATVNSSDATKIDLVLSAPIYNTDVITVSYSGGSIQSVDTRNLEAFSPTAVKINLGANILNNPKWGFETAATTGNITRKAGLDGYWVGGLNDPDKFFYRNTERVAVGSASLRYANPNGISKDITLTGYGISTPTGIPAGDYIISYQVFLEVGNTMKGFKNSNNFGTFGDITWNLETLPRGEWVEVSQVVTTGAIQSGKQFLLKVHQSENAGVTGEQIMYFDNLSWVLLEQRP